MESRAHVSESEIATLKKEVASHKEEIASHKQEITSHKQEIASHKGEIASHKEEIASLKEGPTQMNDCLLSLTLRHVRERFISTYKRKIGEATPRDLEAIRHGNNTAHGGDAAADAQLYEGVGGRTHGLIFVELYRMTPSDVQKIRHRETLEILNIHASVVADTAVTGTSEFYANFQAFIKEFTKSGCNEKYLEEMPRTNVHAAYWKVRNCRRYG
ncbi:unnamed protein product [Tuber aestivum]|uniref:Uncharacterized protein n=1 Tax=Tuber aestivum TaxID=59557 RepID=A0A292Q7K5_9PEZI|nr:unnamed protein product [Tuber aestivum]